MSTDSSDYLGKYLINPFCPDRLRLPFSTAYRYVFSLHHHPDTVNLDLDIFRNASSAVLEAIEGGRPSYGPLLTSSISGNISPTVYRNTLYSLLADMQLRIEAYEAVLPIGLVEVSNLLALYTHIDAIAAKRSSYTICDTYEGSPGGRFCSLPPDTGLLLSCLLASYETDTNNFSPVEAFHHRVVSYAVQLVCMHFFGAYNKQAMLDLKYHARSAPKLKTKEPFDQTTKFQLTNLLSEIKKTTTTLYKRSCYQLPYEHPINAMRIRLLNVLDDAAETINLSTQIALYANRERDI